MNHKDDSSKETVYPAQKTLQMKAGTGNVAPEKIAIAAASVETHKDDVLAIIKILVTAMHRHIDGLSKILEQEDFVSAPEKQAVVNDIVSTMMNIKSQIGYSDAEALNDLTSMILETLDGKKVISTKVKDGLKGYIRLLEELTTGPAAHSPEDIDIAGVKATWAQIASQS
jgi:hypothetical protein